MFFKKEMAKKLQSLLEYEGVAKRDIVDIHFGFDNQVMLDFLS